MPPPPCTQIVMTAWQRNNGVDLFRFVHRRPEAILGHDFLPKLDPFATRRRVVVPIELGMIVKDLDATAHQKEDAKQIDEVIYPQPERKGEVEHRAPLFPVCLQRTGLSLAR